MKFKEWIEKWSAIITLVLFLASVVGWIIDSRVNRKVMKIQLESHDADIEWLVKSMRDQKEFNGGVIMYIKLDSNIDIEDESD